MLNKRIGLIIRGVVSLCFLGIASCVGPAPLEDYSLAYTSLEAARGAQAARYAPGYFSQAEEAYRQALVEFESRQYKEAQARFLLTRQLAEKAENYSILKKAERGEGE